MSLYSFNVSQSGADGIRKEQPSKHYLWCNLVWSWSAVPKV